MGLICFYWHADLKKYVEQDGGATITPIADGPAWFYELRVSETGETALCGSLQELIFKFEQMFSAGITFEGGCDGA